MKRLIYHATRNLDSILESGALRAWFNILGKSEEDLQRQYGSACSNLARVVREYHERIRAPTPDFSDERLANMVGDTTFSWSSDQIEAERLLGIEKEPNFKSNQKYKQLIARTKRFHSLIRNCYVYCGDFDFASGFGNGEGIKSVIEIDVKDLEAKNYLHAGELVWWEIPLTKSTFTAVYTENPENVRESLARHNYGFVKVNKRSFSDRDSCMPFY